MNNTISNNLPHVNVTRDELINRMGLLMDRKDDLKLKLLNPIINRFMRKEYELDYYYILIEILMDEFDVIFTDEEVRASYIMRYGESLADILRKSEELMHNDGVDKLYIPFDYGRKIVTITKEMNSQKLMQILHLGSNLK